MQQQQTDNCVAQGSKIFYAFLLVGGGLFPVSRFYFKNASLCLSKMHGYLHKFMVTTGINLSVGSKLKDASIGSCRQGLNH